MDDDATEGDMIRFDGVCGGARVRLGDDTSGWEEEGEADWYFFEFKFLTFEAASRETDRALLLVSLTCGDMRMRP